MERPLQVYLDDADLEQLETWSRERCTAALSFDHDFRIAGFSLWTAEP